MHESNRDDLILGFGKHKGKSPNQIAAFDPDYIVWLYETFPNKVTKELAEACEHDSRERDDEIRKIIDDE